MREFEAIHEHMLALGLGALAHANWHSNYHSFENPHWSELSVLQAAHAAEILIKARISQEHPLLIFDTLPKPDSEADSPLGLKELIEGGRTFQYSELPDRLWATTGIRIPNLQKYRSFGRLRNAIQHFASPQDLNVSQETIDFIFSVIDPFINSCWGLFAIDYNEDHEPHIYLVEGLIRRQIRFLVSPAMVSDLEYIECSWPKGNREYQAEMERRILDAKLALQEA